MKHNDKRWMRLSLSLAGRGLGRVWPNPAVGCVLVKDERVVGRGWTQDGGRPHAETMALQQAGTAAHGATAYVTLEPCAHHGKTPPCAEALIAAGIKRVVCPLEDPDPRVAGKGFALLRAAGVKVKTGLMSSEAEELSLGFLLNRTIGRPMLTLKLATSLDGRIATQSGESRWITGPQARRQVHLMRSQHDAVLIGRGTAQADDPMLDVRDMGARMISPVRVVADGGLSLSTNSRLARSANQIPLWLCHRHGVEPERRAVWQSLGARLIEVKTNGAGELDTRDMLQKLAQNGLTRVLCEGGGNLAASLIRAELVDRMVIYTAGLALGAKGMPSIAPLAMGHLSEHPRFTLKSVQQIGNDTLGVWEPAQS